MLRTTKILYRPSRYVKRRYRPMPIFNVQSSTRPRKEWEGGSVIDTREKGGVVWSSDEEDSNDDSNDDTEETAKEPTNEKINKEEN
jgi:hypothetical protein